MNKARPATVAVLLLLLALAGCGTSREDRATVGHYKVGKPYKINGRWYYPAYDPGYDRVGTASWYGQDFHGLPTANGEVFDRRRITAAHPTLPLPSMVRVTNLENGRSLDLRVNDRGPFVGNRLIDLSQAAARKLGFESRGLARVRVQFLALADARGTPPAPTVSEAASAPRAIAAAPRRAAPPRLPRPEAERPIQVASLVVPASDGTAGSSCTGEARYVQVGAFAESEAMRAAMASVSGLHQVQVEPAFVGDRALARVRLGPVAGGPQAAALLGQVRARGHTGAFLTSASGSAVGSC
jgi:rare lipoprotein A